MTIRPGKQSDRAARPEPGSLYDKLEERAIEEMNDLNRRVASCRECPRGDYLPTVGSGHPLADIMLIKYGPRYLEVSEGVSFFGRAGSAILKSIERLGVDPLLLYGTNVVKCGGAEGEQVESSCSSFLLEELHIVQPRIAVVMGERALEAINAHAIPGMRPLEWRPGELQEFTPFCKALVTPDLDLCLDSREAKTAFWQSFRTLGDWYRDEPPY